MPETEPVPKDPATMTPEERLVHDKNTAEHSARRHAIRKEIVDTEIRYVKGLNVLNHVFLPAVTQVEANPKEYGADDSDVKALRNNIPTLIGINNQFLAELQKSEASELAQVFLKFANVFKNYSLYFDGYERQLETMSRLKKNKKYEHLMADVEAKCMAEEAHVPLNSYFIAPVQRIPRYVLLLRELLTNSSEGHPQYQDYQSAYKTLSGIASDINEAKRKFEEEAAVRELNHLLSGRPSGFELIKPHRKLIRRGPVTLTMETYNAKKSSMKITQRELFIFSDILMLTKAPDKKGCVVFQVEIPVSAITAERVDGSSVDFTISTAKAYVAFRFPTKEETDEWFHCLATLIDKNRKQRAAKQKLRSGRKSTGLNSLIGDSLKNLNLSRRSGSMSALEHDAAQAVGDAEHADHADHTDHADHADHADGDEDPAFG